MMKEWWTQRNFKPYCMSKISSLACLTLALGLLLVGCAHYQPGNGSTLGFKSIEIEAVKNQSMAPQANQVLNHDLRETFIQSGKVSVESTNAHALLKVVLTDFDRETITTNSRDTGLARKYTLSLSADCTLIDQIENVAFFENRTVSAKLDVYLDSGQTRSETIALPLLSKKLAESIEQEVLQAW
ncbi:MAG: hypothetical protein CMI18_04970 [Opitutaceae bacterium]|nr:hypothetical protein [Opitutaceae bacterium]